MRMISKKAVVNKVNPMDLAHHAPYVKKEYHMELKEEEPV